MPLKLGTQDVTLKLGSQDVAAYLGAESVSAFDPTSIDGLALWLDAADTSTVTLDTGVSVWADKSGNGRNASQSTGNNQPIYTAGGLNGKNVLTFDGTNDTMPTASFTQNQPSTMFAVVQVLNTSGSINFIDGFGVNRAAIFRRVTNNWTAFAGAELVGSTSTDTNWHTFSAVFNTTSSLLRVDGTQIASGNVGSQNVTTGLSLGSYNGTSGYLNGSIAEVLFYGGVLTASQIAAVETHLQKKWGL